MSYMAGVAASEIRDEARRFGRLVTERATAPFSSWACAAQPERLRVGFVSGELYRHSAGYFMDAFLAQLDQSRLELLAYPTSNKADDLTGRLQQYCTGWTPLVGLSDEAAAQRIHADGVHVLIDLSGHSVENRLPMLAWRPAPVQATWLGCFVTTGMAEIDYVLADPYVAPPEIEDHFTEAIWRLPERYLCFTAPDIAVEVAPPPARALGTVTFGCFNNLSKMNHAVVALWARVLKAVPGSRLLLKAKQLGSATVREFTLQRFAAHGIGPEQLILEGPSPRADYLAAYHRVDITLDPFPYTGGTTSVEGLWMGVPVITRRGDSFVSHMGESIVQNAGLADWIARDDDDYVAKAVSFAADIGHLAALRAGLRSRILASPLFDAPRFARHFEAAVWEMWERRKTAGPGFSSAEP